MREKYEELIKKHAYGQCNISDRTFLKNDLGFDSLLIVDLYADIEDAFNFEFSSEDDFEETFRTVGSLWNIVKERGTL
jgi:acyl carrier protein